MEVDSQRGGEVADRGHRANADDSEAVVVLHRLLKLTNRLMAPFSTHLSHRYRISLNEFRLLMSIGTLGRTASHEVAQMTGVNAMSIPRAVATLERHGRITVTVDQDNRRRKWLSLTEEGERLYRLMRPQSEQVAHYLFDAISPGELDAFKSIVERLIDRLDATDDHGNSLFLESTKPPEER